MTIRHKHFVSIKNKHTILTLIPYDTTARSFLRSHSAYNFRLGFTLHYSTLNAFKKEKTCMQTQTYKDIQCMLTKPLNRLNSIKMFAVDDKHWWPRTSDALFMEATFTHMEWMLQEAKALLVVTKHLKTHNIVSIFYDQHCMVWIKLS